MRQHRRKKDWALATWSRICKQLVIRICKQLVIHGDAAIIFRALRAAERRGYKRGYEDIAMGYRANWRQHLW